MKIAMFTDSYYPRINGVTVSVHSYALELTKLGHKVAIICLEYTEEQQRSTFFDEKKSDASSPFKIIRIPSQWIVWSDEDRFARFDCWHYLKKQVDAFADLVHGNGEWSIGYLGAMYARHRHLPFVYTFHTMWEDYIANYTSFITSLIPDKGLRLAGRTLVKFYLKRAKLIIAPTKHIAQVVARYGISRPLEIIPTGIPDNKFGKYSIFRAQSLSSTLSRKFPAIKDRKIMLYVGRIVKEKNLAFLLIDPFLICEDYEADIDDREMLKIGIKDPAEVMVMTIVTVPSDGSAVTANLQGPLIINKKNRMCMQAILEGTRWTTKHNIIEALKRKEGK